MPSQPYRYGTTLALSDAATVSVPHHALYVGHAADAIVALAVEMAAGGAIVTLQVPNGTTLPIQVKKVRLTGTTVGTVVVALHP